MPRTIRVDVAHQYYHVINRANARMALFETGYDYKRFEEVLEQAVEKYPAINVLSYCVMPNHFHLLVLPTESNELQRFMHWLTMTHTQR